MTAALEAKRAEFIEKARADIERSVQEGLPSEEAERRYRAWKADILPLMLTNERARMARTSA